MQRTSEHFPNLGFGLGLRPKHYAHIFEHQPDVDWFEIISENFMDTDGRPRRNLARIAERYPLVMHGVALSIGTVDPLNSEYLTKLKKLADDIQPAWISDHLCWTGIAHKNAHDLLPIPYTEEALRHIVARIQHVQDFLGRPIALENPSTYLEFTASQMPESVFMAEMAKQSGCHLLLDVNNVYVTCYNHQLDPRAYIDALPLDRVVQIHLSGHTNKGTHIIDTHDDAVTDEVWRLYEYAVQRAGRVPNTMVEWDDNIPEFAVLYAELDKAKAVARDALSKAPMPNSIMPEINNHYKVDTAMSLADSQNMLQAAIVLGKAIDTDPIRATPSLPSAERLAIYVNAYRARLYDVTAEDYPVLQHYLGNAAFDHMLHDFLDTVQSTHFNIGRYAAHLPHFLSKYASADPFALELATLENAVSQLADPPETVALTPAHLQGMTAEALMQSVLHPRQALQLFAFHYPANAYFRAVKDEQSPAPPVPAPSYLAVFRHQDSVWRMDLEAAEYNLLSALFAGKTVGDALDAVDPTTTDKLSEYFSRWMHHGMLAHQQRIAL